MDEMDTSSNTSSASDKTLSEEAEEMAVPTAAGGDSKEAPEPMVGSPPLFTPIPSTSAMMLAAAAAASNSSSTTFDHQTDMVWMSPKKDAMEGIPTDLSALQSLPGTPTVGFADHVTQATEWFDSFKEEEQTWFVRMLLSRMHHHQHGSINSYLKPILQRDFITLLPKQGLDHVAETILSYLDAKSLCAAELGKSASQGVRIPNVD